MASTLTPLLVLLLVFSSHACLTAVPVTRIGSLMHGHQAPQVSENTLMSATEENLEEKNIAGRLDIELNDYPGSGANNRHTPRPPQFGKGCFDC